MKVKADMSTMREYWETRKNMEYYKEVIKIIKDKSSDSILDVGSWNTPIISFGNYDIREAVNLEAVPKEDQSEGVRYTFCDFMDYEPNRTFSVVSCLQVLEHLEDDTVIPFTQKLFRLAKDTVIISVPYKWEKNSCKYHLQDPVDEEKILSWTGKAPSYSKIIKDDKLSRIVCVYEK